MANPMLHAFFIGRALAEMASEQVERAVTEAVGQVGRFDAEQRENLRQFTDEVIARAQQAESGVASGAAPTQGGSADGSTAPDLQATVDNLRAEIAQVRVALQQYRAS